MKSSPSLPDNETAPYLLQSNDGPSLFRVLELLVERRRTMDLTLRCTSGKRGAVYLRDGEIVDAEFGTLSGELALHEILSGPGERFQIEVKPACTRRRVAIERDAPVLLRESLSRAASWAHWSARLPPLDSILIVNFACASAMERLEDVAPILPLLDGQRTLTDVIDDSELLQLPTMEALWRLLKAGALEPPTVRADSTADSDANDTLEVEAWLRAGAQPLRGKSALAIALVVAGVAAFALHRPRAHHASRPAAVIVPAVPPAPPVPQRPEPVEPAVAPPVETKPVESADELLRQANVLRTRGKLRGAVQRLELALQTEPAHVGSLVALAQCELELGASARTIALATRATEADPHAALAFLALGAGHQDLGHTVAAKAAYVRYLELAPSGPYAADVRAVLKAL